MRALSDRVRLVRDRISGVEALHARFAGYAYDLHWHDEWLVGVTERGVQDFFCRGARRRSTEGRVILIEPGELHDGEAGDEGGFAYSMLYLPQSWVGEAGGFRANIVDDARLGGAVRRACRALAWQCGRLEREAALDAVLGRLRLHLGGRARDGGRGDDAGVARRARERLHAAVAEDIGADALARDAGAADRFRLARAFRAAYGTSPHAYLVQIRLLRARGMLAGGGRPAAVAAECGFADQSHLGRWFRRAYGLTPAAYRACCTGVPDGAAGGG